MVSPSAVWIVSIKNGEDTEEIKHKFNILLEKSDFDQGLSLQEREIIAIKMHFGEINTYNYIKPPIVKVIIDKIRERRARPLLAETSCIYTGKRKDAVDHLELASEHGFEYSQIGAPVIILDGIHGESATTVKINQKHFKEIQMAAGLSKVQGLVSLARFKGHGFLGFGGTLKNIAMGLSSRLGKIQQHMNVRPQVSKDKCTFCKSCINICPENAIKEVEKKAHIDQSLCVGCGECLVECPEEAILFDAWKSIESFEEKLIEYAFGILKTIKKKYFFNFAYTVAKYCDCLQKENTIVAPDIGILASQDPVALDKATNDLILERTGKDIWKEVHPRCDWKRQFEYASEIGLGQLEYSLKVIKC